ncbi:hypothetical protein G3I01_15985 [Gramella sp. MT6]|uniref:hypothetical protein n=1 Tax=Gramella sp. MT6 TaxID=2705471 RepID=UPI001C5D4B1C|nr:hypothetical protein [Gramella sp. MT6]QYA26930.1 hypothetical protein G3I01_15985 [Gramella sp. MT6]
MKNLLWFLLIVFSFKCYGQHKAYKFYHEKGFEISRKEFYEIRNNPDYLPLYLENDTARYGVIFYREKYGLLKDSEFQNLKDYLNSLKSDGIAADDVIVINYLTGVSEAEQNKNSRTNWNIFDRNYVRKLKKITDVSHFWISPVDKEKLKYFYSNRVNWQKDNENLVKELFFPFELSYGYFIIIKPDGTYYYCLGEYSKYYVWEKTEEMLTL